MKLPPELEKRPYATELAKDLLNMLEKKPSATNSLRLVIFVIEEFPKEQQK